MAKKSDSDDLRWLAEEADGRRGEDLVVIRTGTGRLGLVPPNDPLAKQELFRIDVHTEFEGGGMKGGAEVWIRYQGKELRVDEDADCLFWTQSAFEKFVIPYYTRFRSPAEIQAMKNKYFAANNLCVLHFPPSDDLGFPAALDRCDKVGLSKGRLKLDPDKDD